MFYLFFFMIVTHLGPLIHMLQDFRIWSVFRGEIRGWKTNSAVSCHWYRGVSWVVSLTPRSQAHRCPHHTQSQNGDLLTDTRLQTAMLSLLSQFRDVNKTLGNGELSHFCHIIKIRLGFQTMYFFFLHKDKSFLFLSNFSKKERFC